jgi:glycosyltransferase involved in cell wall biosynthesis
MTYWLLTTEYPPFHGGGISTYAFFSAKMLCEKGHSVLVLVVDDSIQDHILEEKANNLTIVRFNSNRSKLFKSLGYSARLSYEFARMVEQIISLKGKPDYIEAQDYLGIAYYLLQFKHLGYSFIKDVPLIITLHSPAYLYLEYNRVPTYRFPEFWTCEMEKQSITGADQLISPTRFMAAQVRSTLNGKLPPVAVIRNPYYPETGICTGFTRNKIVYYGKLVAQKGSFELLHYFSILWNNGFPHSLYLIGGTDIVYHPELQTMGQLVKKKYGSYIDKGLLRLKGKIDPAEKRQYLNDAHVIILPSIFDNLPYVIIEAMSLGKVVLASRQGGQEEMIEHGISGFLFDHSIPGDFEKQLKIIISLSDEEIHEIGKQARALIEEMYSPNKIANEKIPLLNKIDGANGEIFPFLYQENIQTVADSSDQHSLSVVIPFYNMGNFIDDCLNSIRQSIYPVKEIIIVNDGSTDQESLEKLSSYQGDPAICIIHQENNGVAETRNRGARKATGQYLAFLDADDKVHPEYFEKAIKVLSEKKNVFFAGSWVQYFENSHHLWPAFNPQPPYCLAHNPVNSSALVYKRTAFLAGGLNDKTSGYGLEDYESVVNMMKNGFNGVVLPEPLFYYRVRKGSMIRNITREKLLYSNKYISEKHQSYYSIFATQLINLLNANGPGYLFDNPTFPLEVTTSVQSETGVKSWLKQKVKQNEFLKRIALSILLKIKK